MNIFRKHKLGIAAATATAMLAGGVAWASIPDGAGVITGCYDANHNLQVTDTSVSGCPSGTTTLRWNQRGVSGPTGPAGPPGTANVYGVRMSSRGDVIMRKGFGTNGVMWSPGRFYMNSNVVDFTRCIITATPAGGAYGITASVLAVYPNWVYVDMMGIDDYSWPVHWSPKPAEVYISASC